MTVCLIALCVASTRPPVKHRVPSTCWSLKFAGVARLRFPVHPEFVLPLIVVVVGLPVASCVTLKLVNVAVNDVPDPRSVKVVLPPAPWPKIVVYTVGTQFSASLKAVKLEFARVLLKSIRTPPLAGILCGQRPGGEFAQHAVERKPPRKTLAPAITTMNGIFF